MTTARFVLDESTWAAAPANVEVLSNAISQLLDRIEAAKSRREGVVIHDDYYWSTRIGNYRLFSVLFEKECSLKLDRDVAERLRIALDRLDPIKDFERTEIGAAFLGGVRCSPGVNWSYWCCLRGHHVAVLPLPISTAPVGWQPVTVLDRTIEICFVTTESQHLGFFRDIISKEKADKSTFMELAHSAFPALEWADDVERSLGKFSRPYLEIRSDLAKALGGLNDHGSACFRKLGDGDPRALTRSLRAKIGFEVSDENGKTKRHGPSKKDRTRRYRGAAMVFWWHVKLQPHVDRIYFRYEQDSIVVGLFKDHCVLPD